MKLSITKKRFMPLEGDLLDLERACYPRVSEIIGRQTQKEMDAIPSDILANACERGTNVHELCSLYAFFGNLEDQSLNPNYAPYVFAFKEWYDENVQQLLSTDQRLYDDALRFTGEYDMIVKLKDGRVALVDIKTSSAVSKNWPIQLAAYSMLCDVNNIRIDLTCIVHLKKTCTFPVTVSAFCHEHKNLEAHKELFLSCLDCYRFFELKEVICTI